MLKGRVQLLTKLHQRLCFSSCIPAGVGYLLGFVMKGYLRADRKLQWLKGDIPQCAMDYNHMCTQWGTGVHTHSVVIIELCEWGELKNECKHTLYTSVHTYIYMYT